MSGKDELIEIARGLRQKVEAQLDRLIPTSEQPPCDLHRSMRHTLLAPGKRIRALLTIFVARHFGGDETRAMRSACALEMVHAASLILDDLPAMDNASLRRGLPANHQIYGEATAILAAIALLNRAFGVIAEDESLSPDQRVQLTRMLSRSVGSEGLVAGQEQDLKWSPERATPDDVALVHARKTASLFSAAAEIGAVAALASRDQVALMGEFGMTLGLAFQIFDDLLDATADRDGAGKDVLQDGVRPSLVLAVGQDAASNEAQSLIEAATGMLSGSGGGDKTALRHFAMWLIGGLENRLRTASLENR
jgi:geranylgeranyl diphosphate synthase type II